MDPQFIEVETDFTYGDQSKSKEQFQSKILSQNFKKSEMLDVVGQGHVCVCVCVCVCPRVGLSMYRNISKKSVRCQIKFVV